jgi:hypothetical protein
MRWRRAARRGAFALAAAVSLGAAHAWQRHRAAPEPRAGDGGETPEVFRRYAGQVVKLQVLETGSGAKAVTGSGFFVTGRGHILTNYHVVANLVHEPERYRAQLLDSAGGTRTVRVIAVDAVHDLAVLASDLRPARFFTLGDVAVAQGQRLYSLGHPADLGIAIVEGTYNGRLPHTLYPRIHFTGAINPGMSGGPTITIAGRVVGVNVATAGNEQSFLVPVDEATPLLARALAGRERDPDSLLGDVGRQLLAYQDAYVARLFTGTVPSVTLGHWRLPTQPTDVFNCWGETDREHDSYEVVHHYCSTGDDVYLSADQSSGTIEFEHDYLSTESLNRFRFHVLYSREFRSVGQDYELDAAGDDDVTPYRCHGGNVRSARVTTRALFCARRYKRLPGLYDVVLRVATLGQPRSGVLSTLKMSGVSFRNAKAVARRYVEAIAWAP